MTSSMVDRRGRVEAGPAPSGGHGPTRRARRFSVRQLRAMPRPAGYLEQMRACARRASVLARVGHRPRWGWLEFDLDAPCYRQLKALYQGSGAAPAAARSADVGDAGLGDTVARWLHGLGAQRLTRLWTRVTGRPCGCQGRRDLLNRLWRYR